MLPLLAKTVVYNLGFNDAKRLFANPTGREHEIIRVCCATKALVSWNCGEVSTICRERCGGQGFLAYNRIHEGIIGGHSGMTAEGDNRVLMQKIVKDILSDTQKERHRLPELTKCPLREIPKQSSIADLETLSKIHKQFKN